MSVGTAPRAQAALVAVATLLVGMVPGALAFALNPDIVRDIGLDVVTVPGWLFTAVWTVIYPAMGLAAWRLWTLRPADVAVPFAVLLAGFLQSHSFWLTDSLRTTAVIDATGVLLSLTTLWVFSRSSRSAARWLLPWVVWMPLTLALKIAVIVGSAP
ncbi:tryptophan-rich sensory protein [Pseudonocardia pini]|uniref:tryptophan-rich sensory protein n=1 Tax=Pseudonocardia pini TaxID=2758030 RepID=UPI0015EFF525|nr:tryptophan-rich sensory protein [Pseudonocardia pini]